MRPMLSTTENSTTRIAMWSGPRNISTALMRSFENRADTVVWDEPFYAAELAATGRKHPMRDEVVAAGPTDPEAIVARLLGPIIDPAKPAASVFYQKHMTHHMLPDFPRDWIDHPELVNAFLIREPERVLESYAKAWSAVSLEEIGVPQQLDIFDRVADRLGHAPPVLEASDILVNPTRALTALCTACGIAFDPTMLRWPAGRRASDGVWAPVWYKTVETSTGFAPPHMRPLPQLDSPLAHIAEAARPAYERLRKYKIGATAAGQEGSTP